MTDSTRAADVYKRQVYAPEGAVLSINGVELDESYKTGDSVTLALFEGLESYGEAPAMEAWEIGGLHLTPEISAVDASGAELSAPYLQDGAYVFQPAPDAELESSQRDYAEKFYELYSAFAANKDEKDVYKRQTTRPMSTRPLRPARAGCP